MKRILLWCGRHKIWAFLIVAVVNIVIVSLFANESIDSIAYGEAWGIVFWFYLAVIWIYGVIKKRIFQKRLKDNA